MPKERRARSLTVSAVSLTFKVDTARRQRMLRTESAQDGRTKIARAQPRIRDGERTSSTLTDATSPSPTPSATRHCRRPICRKQPPDQHQQGRRAFTLLVCCSSPVSANLRGGGEADRGRYGPGCSLGRRTAIRHLGCETTRCRRPAMRLPSECYQMQKTIETHFTSPLPATIAGRGSVGLRRHPRRAGLPERVLRSQLVWVSQRAPAVPTPAVGPPI